MNVWGDSIIFHAPNVPKNTQFKISFINEFNYIELLNLWVI